MNRQQLPRQPLQYIDMHQCSFSRFLYKMLELRLSLQIKRLLRRGGMDSEIYLLKHYEERHSVSENLSHFLVKNDTYGTQLR